MSKKLTKVIALALALVMVFALAACGGNTTTPTQTDTPKTDAPANSDTPKTDAPAENNTPAAPVTYTYQDSVSTMATNWNPHTYQTSDDSYPADFLRMGLYSFIYNDELHPLEGKDPYTGYVIVPEMAAEMPVDVTEQVKAEHPEFGIPESATAGYAYTIDLNPLATWEDGTPINADTYVYSMKKLLDPALLNYRAADYYAQGLSIAGAENYANQGKLEYGAIGVTTTEYLANGGAVEDLYVDAYDFWNADASYLDEAGNALQQYVSVLDETVYGANVDDAFSGKQLYDEYLGAGAPYEAYSPDELYTVTGQYATGLDYDSTVGLYKTGEYQITIVFAKSLAGFNLLYNLGSNWIVKEDLYEANLSESEGVWSSTYNTSVETTSSYGPYKMTVYQADKFMKFEKNENWYGWTDGKHVYVDPEDGETYQMYQTDIIECEVVPEAETNKLMFLKGELMGYGLQAEDFATYRNSDYVYFTPDETIYFLILNGYKEAIEGREKADDFDTATRDLQMLLNLNFRKAIAVTYDKELFASTVSPARSGGYAIIGNAYVYDPETGAMYRDTDQAKQALCDFYSVDLAAFNGDLDAAVASITGYDPETAKTLFGEAFTEGLEAGYITDADADGKCDQSVVIEYSLSADSDFMTKTIDYLNEKMNEVTAGTPFEGKVSFAKSAPYGNDWSNKLKAGLADTALAGWSGSRMNPFSLTDLYVNPSYQYDAGWFDATKVDLTLSVDGEEVTMNLRQWSDALNGATVTAPNGKDYCFGDGIADVETRLTILAAIEGKVLGTYDYIPMLQNASAALLSKQVFYVVEDWNPIMGRGGITYMKYNYDDAAWAEYVASQGGTLTY